MPATGFSQMGCPLASTITAPACPPGALYGAMKIGSVDAPSALRTTVSDGIRRSGRERQRGGFGGADALEDTGEPVSRSERTIPTAPTRARRRSCLRVMV
jgi:hypothetical protein